MKSKRTKALDITQKAKRIVWERDREQCIICNSPNAMPNAHFIPRSKGGLGVERNIVTLCHSCHFKYDQTTLRNEFGEMIKGYLKEIYSDWNERDLIYKKYDWE